jgi:hypothetical protein
MGTRKVYFLNFNLDLDLILQFFTPFSFLIRVYFIFLFFYLFDFIKILQIKFNKQI